MKRVFIAGVLLAIGAAVLVVVSDSLGLGLKSVLLATAIGGAVGLLNRGGPIPRVGSFLVGFVIAWLSYFLRAGLLPDSMLGRVIYVVVVIVLITVICGLTKDRLPLWSALLGAALFIGGYDFLFVTAPYNVITESTATAPALLLPFAVAFLLASLVTKAERTPSPTPEMSAEPSKSEVA